MSEVSDALFGRVAKAVYGGFFAIMLSVLTWAANSIKEEFHLVNDHLGQQDRELGAHTGALTIIESNEKSLLDSLKDSNTSITSLAGTIAAQAATNAALKQRMDDTDEFLREIRPNDGSRAGSNHDHPR